MAWCHKHNYPQATCHDCERESWVFDQGWAPVDVDSNDYTRLSKAPREEWFVHFAGGVITGFVAGLLAASLVIALVD